MYMCDILENNAWPRTSAQIRLETVRETTSGEKPKKPRCLPTSRRRRKAVSAKPVRMAHYEPLDTAQVYCDRDLSSSCQKHEREWGGDRATCIVDLDSTPLPLGTFSG